MKKRIITIFGSILAPSLAFAETLKENNNDTSALGFITRITNDFILPFVGALTVLFLVIGGIQYMTSMGNEEKLQVAKRTLLYAIIGLLLVILSIVIVSIVKTNITSVVK